MNITICGLVLREVDYHEKDMMLTILTGEHGRISARCRNARTKKSRFIAGTQLLTYSEFSLFEQKGRYTVDEAEPIEQFSGLRKDILSLTLGCYFAEVSETLAQENIPSEVLLTDLLNLLYGLSQGIRSPQLIKAVFELRAAAISGWQPDLDCCTVCGEQPEYPMLDISEGGLVCDDCRTGGKYLPLDSGSLSAARYILNCDSKRMLSFKLGEVSAALLSAAAERFLLDQLGRGFGTLDMYKSML